MQLENCNWWGQLFSPFWRIAMTYSVADLCQAQRLTIAELAERSGLEVGRVTAIALGRWTPSPGERQHVAAVFGVGVDEIAWGHKTPIQHLYGHGPG
jgi:transcriptional regulator with XRE-family HTH domain